MTFQLTTGIDSHISTFRLLNRMFIKLKIESISHLFDMRAILKVH